GVRRFGFAALEGGRGMRKEGAELLSWAKGAIEDEDILSGLLDLASKHRISADDLLSFLQEQRMGHIPSRELRAKLREGGKKWKAVERMAAKAQKNTELFLAELAGRAVEVEMAARVLSRSVIETDRHRTF